MRRELSMVLIAAALVLPAAGGWAQTQPEAERLLSVSGEGSVTAHPDIALITLGVVSEAVSARDALADNSRSMTRVLDALKAEGLQPRDLQTSGFSVEPVYSQPPRSYEGPEPFRSEIVGYRVRNNLTVRIRDLERVGAILDMVITVGANSVSGPSFSVDDPAPLEDEARRAAVEEALRKARLYAEAAGVALGPIFRIDEGYSRAPEPIQPGAAFRMEAAASPPVPIEGGELTFQAQVSVSWLLAE